MMYTFITTIMKDIADVPFIPETQISLSFNLFTAGAIIAAAAAVVFIVKKIKK